MTKGTIELITSSLEQNLGLRALPNQSTYLKLERSAPYGGLLLAPAEGMWPLAT